LDNFGKFVKMSEFQTSHYKWTGRTGLYLSRSENWSTGNSGFVEGLTSKLLNEPSLQESASRSFELIRTDSCPGLSIGEVKKRWRAKKTESSKILELVTGEMANKIAETLSWNGLLLKRSRWPLGAWKPREFEINVQPAQPDTHESSTAQKPIALIIYHSKKKGEQHLYVHDVHRERHLDSGPRIAFSVGLAAYPNAIQDMEGEQKKSRRERMLLMAATDLEAVMFLSCLRRILEPERVRPTMQEAIHFPGAALVSLE
jgi:hypothetical protein